MEFVAQRSDAGWGEVGLFEGFGKVVARMGFKRHHATCDIAVPRFTLEQGQHGLVPAVHPIKVTDGQGAGLGLVGVVKTSENSHV